MNDLELFMTEAYDEGVVTEVIRPAAVLPESSARAVLVELAMRDVHGHGVWHAQPWVKQGILTLELSRPRS